VHAVRSRWFELGVLGLGVGESLAVCGGEGLEDGQKLLVVGLLLRECPSNLDLIKPQPAPATTVRTPPNARLQQWAFGDGGLRDIWAQLPEQGQAIFKLLRVRARGRWFRVPEQWAGTAAAFAWFACLLLKRLWLTDRRLPLSARPLSYSLPPPGRQRPAADAE